MDLQKNFFELFDLPATFRVDLDLLADRYRAIQSSVHPDRYADAGSHDRRMSLQYATLINEAVTTLRSPLKRSIYLLQLLGRELGQEESGQANLEPGFLMQQIEFREELEDIEESKDPESALTRFRSEVMDVIESLEAKFEGSVDGQGEDGLDEAEIAVRKMQFMHKLLAEADRVEERIFDF